MPTYFHYEGLRAYLIVEPTDWEWRMSKSVLYEDYKFVRGHEARLMLEELARRDRCLLHSVYRAFVSPHPSPGLWDEALLEGLLRGLGHDPALSDRDAPPSFGLFYVLREERPRQKLTPRDPWKPERDVVEEARAAPRGYVAIETVDPEGRAVSGVRCEVLLADGEVHTITTDSYGRARLEPIPQGRCHISLPGLDGSVWRAEDGAQGTLVDHGRRARHIVARGETLARIAHLYALSSWKELWDAADNEKLRALRKLPNLVLPGDELAIPGRKIHQLSRATDTTHRLIVKGPTIKPPPWWSW